MSSQPPPYAELLAEYQQACADRDALSAQLDKAKRVPAPPLNDSAGSPSPSSSLFPSSSLSPPAASSSSSLPLSASPASLDSLRSQHSVIQSALGSLQQRTARILHDQERELIRAFRLRLSEVSAELAEERKRSESGSAEWVARCRKLSEELDWLKELTEKLTAENRDMTKEARRMRKQMRVHEEDREFLIQQLVSAKKDAARLRQQLDKHAAATDLAASNGTGGGGMNAREHWLARGKEEKTATG